MNVKLEPVSLVVAGVSLIGAGISAITAGWDRWSYCWERGTYACHQAQNDAPLQGVLSGWNADVLVLSWLLLGVGSVALAVLVWPASRGASVLVGLCLPGAVILAATEVINPYITHRTWVPLVELFVWSLGAGFLIPALLLMQRCDAAPGPRTRVWRWVAAAFLLLAAASPLSEFLVLLMLDGSHDTPTLTGIMRGTLYCLAVGCLVVASRLPEAKTPEPIGSGVLDGEPITMVSGGGLEPPRPIKGTSTSS